ncbi:TIGR04372 family glycosyltransferase [Bradyrhizobium ontarionense]|uniref:TIGR04372 family glycosyltransferase n=1 Tax=Bradyrhizobium ontarionense TaxID=2898149 RepID=A0ABY3RB11_9BRAD|nr:TIGR04372 family glycosyltransferase [Bradyrhizobium sp. A19]UFZ04401.1 TIGR04372 family glycosyltransferase [Bradyrhizobium sp. A19]
MSFESVHPTPAGHPAPRQRGLLRSLQWNLAVHVVKAIAWYLNAVGQRAESLKDLFFALLTFKQAFMVAIIFHRHARRHEFDRQFRYFCGPDLDKEMQWVLASPRSDQYCNELILFLLMCDKEKRVLELFPNIDWERVDDEFMEAIGRLTKKLTSGYFMELLAQAHTINWTALPPQHLRRFAELINIMLEHRNFRFEQTSFEGKQNDARRDGDPIPFEAPLDRYIPEYFCDKELIETLVSQLDLPRHDDILTAREDQGQYWERFPADHPQRKVLSEINLFYAYRNLLLTTYHSGEGFHVPQVYINLTDTQRRLRRHLPAPSAQLKAILKKLDTDLPEVKLLSPDWSALIGHNGHLNVHLMMRDMGWWQGQPLLLAYKDRIANKPFLSLFSDICPTFTLGENVSAGVWHELASLTPFIGDSHQAFRFEDGRAVYWNDAGSLALKQWESRQRTFPLRDIYDRRLLADNRVEQTYQDYRRRWGMADGDWFVCLHVRDAHTRNDTEGVGESIRNASLATYLDAARHITECGGWVVRMGGRRVPPFPKMERVVDYARSDDQFPEMDIHLMRRARMFIGTTSGFAYVASSFGIPTAMVNALSSIGLLWSTDTRFALKPVHRTDGRMLSLSEWTSERYRWAYPTHESMARAELVVSESSSDEILETVREVLEISDPRRKGPAPGVDNSWEHHVQVPGFFGSSRPSRYFLEKYARNLLREP